MTPKEVDVDPEFMDEDELLLEFHRAGLLLPEERLARENQAIHQQAMTSLLQNTRPTYDNSALQNVARQAQMQGPHPANLGTFIGGGLLGAFGPFTRSFEPR